jgi:hypothetical protein
VVNNWRTKSGSASNLYTAIDESVSQWPGPALNSYVRNFNATQTYECTFDASDFDTAGQYENARIGWVGDAMHESLPSPVYWIWNFMVASYAPLMLGAAGFAFKVEMQAATEAQPATDLQPIAEPVESQAVAMQPEPVQVAPQANANDVQAEKLDTATRRNEVARAKRANPQVTNNELASIFDVDASTIYRDVTHLQKNGILNGTH